MNLTPPRITLEQIRTLMLSWWGNPKAFGNAISAITRYTFDAAPTAVIELLCAAKHTTRLERKWLCYVHVMSIKVFLKCIRTGDHFVCTRTMN